MPDTVALVVDDEDDICHLLSIYLRRFFSRVERGKTLAEGLRLAAEFRPAFLVLDNNLPDGIGIQYVEQFRNNCEYILIISAMHNLEEQAFQAGADQFLSKPVSFRDLDKLIKNKGDN